MKPLDLDHLIVMLDPQCDEETLEFVKSALQEWKSPTIVEVRERRSDQQTVDPFGFDGPTNDPRYW